MVYVEVVNAFLAMKDILEKTATKLAFVKSNSRNNFLIQEEYVIKELTEMENVETVLPNITVNTVNCTVIAVEGLVTNRLVFALNVKKVILVQIAIFQRFQIPNFQCSQF